MGSMRRKSTAWGRRDHLGSVIWVAAKMAVLLAIGLAALYSIIVWIAHLKGLAYVVGWWSRVRLW